MFFRVISAGRQRWKRCISLPYLGSGKPLLLTVPWPRPVTGPSEWRGGWETQGSTGGACLCCASCTACPLMQLFCPGSMLGSVIPVGCDGDAVLPQCLQGAIGRTDSQAIRPRDAVRSRRDPPLPVGAWEGYLTSLPASVSSSAKWGP